MVQRSDFQAAALYWSAGSYAASSLIGDVGLSIPEIVDTATGLVQQYVPIPDISGPSAEDKARGVITYLTDGALAAGAIGAAFWKRIQLVGLAIVAALSGHGLSEAVQAVEAYDSADQAAVMLQSLALGVSTWGLGGMASGRLGRIMGRGRSQTYSV